jgi:hypothetical protein
MQLARWANPEQQARRLEQIEKWLTLFPLTLDEAEQIRALLPPGPQ